jgi:hypothetical protein
MERHVRLGRELLEIPFRPFVTAPVRDWQTAASALKRCAKCTLCLLVLMFLLINAMIFTYAVFQIMRLATQYLTAIPEFLFIR